MSIASEITRINNNISSAYTACDNKGATMPVTQNSANLATCIGSISQSSGLNREVVSGVYRTPTTSFTFTLPNGATDIGNSAMYYAFYYSSGLTSADLSSLTTLSGNSALGYAFASCFNLASVDLSNITTISGISAMNAAFQLCSSLANISLQSLTTVNGNYAMNSAFQDCTSLTNFPLASLTTISGSSALYYAFSGCTGLTSVSFSNLTTLTGSEALKRAFDDCTNLTSISFPSLTSSSFGSSTSQFDEMLYGVTGCTVHFPTSLQSVIGNWTSVQNGFGGTNTTVLFDIAGETTRTITLESEDFGGSMDSDSLAVAQSIFDSGASSCTWGEAYGVTATDYTFTTPSAGTTLTVQAISMDSNPQPQAIQNSLLVVVNNTNVLSYPSYTGDALGYIEDPTSIPQGSVNLAGNTQVTLRFIEPTDFYAGFVYNMSWTEVAPSS